jgi:Flp pilus assembly protein TadG
MGQLDPLYRRPWTCSTSPESSIGRWRAFRSDRRGNVAVIFAMVPLLYLAVRGLTT